MTKIEEIARALLSTAGLSEFLVPFPQSNAKERRRRSRLLRRAMIDHLISEGKK